MHKETILSSANKWLSSTFDKDTQQQVLELVNSNTKELEESFYKHLEFGTAGLRGIMGVGTNRINKYTLGKATQGLSNYLNQKYKGDITVAIAYDCRHNSDSFAKIVADIFTANHIKVFLYEGMRPTPQLSFTVKYLNCKAGIVLTASHNPPNYNGYKVYGDDGAQIVTPEDDKIINEILKVDYSDIKFEGNDALLQYISQEVDTAFINASIQNMRVPLSNRNDLKIVFTSLHGTAIKLMPELFERAGYQNVHFVAQQREPNGNFPTVNSPNPEEPEAFKMALELAEKVNADIVIATDPDADRLGVAVRDLQGKLRQLNGNETMTILTAFLIKKWHNQNRIDGNQFVVSTIVSTNLIAEIAKYNNVQHKICLTGFKWIAKLIKDSKHLEFIGGGEESFGYMPGDYVRDKDAISASLLACEIAAEAKSRGSSIFMELLQLYKTHNFFKEHLIALVKTGMDGAKQIEDLMRTFRTNPLHEIDGEAVRFVLDYQSSIKKDLLTGISVAIDLPKSNVLIFITEKGTKLALRPSGTEPKIKFYISVNQPLESIEDYQKVEDTLKNKISRIACSLNNL